MALREYDYEKEPTVSIVKKILTDAIKMKASDIHFDPTENELVIKFRINGDLSEYTIAPENVKVNILTRIKILARLKITDSLIPQLGSINFQLDNKPYNMRVSTLPIADGEKIVAHISNYANNVKEIDKLGFNKEDTEKIQDLIKEEQGILLITGNASSGKTTTLYSILKTINTKENNIISIEDPINMKIKGINQVKISPDRGLTYRNALRSAMLQDSNIIAINDLVDDETTQTALKAAVTGKLIISTMHTKTINQTIESLINANVENYLLGSNLIGIISQRMVKKLCPKCRKKKKATDFEKKVIKVLINQDIEELYYPKGCQECKDGYIGQIPIAEVVKIDNDLKHAISNHKNNDPIRNFLYSSNTTIIQDGLNKAIEGETSFQEVMRVLDIHNDIPEKETGIINFILGKTEDIVNEPQKKEKTPTTETKEEKALAPEKIETEAQKNTIDSETTPQKVVNQSENTNVSPDNSTTPTLVSVENELKENNIPTPQVEPQFSIPEPEVTVVTNDNNNLEESQNNNQIINPTSQIEQPNQAVQEIIQTAPTSEPTSQATPQVIPQPIPVQAPAKSNFQLSNLEDDDEDDDDFNYGNSYINNF